MNNLYVILLFIFYCLTLDFLVKLITGRSTIWWAKNGKIQGKEDWKE